MIRRRDKKREFQIVTFQNAPTPPMHPALYEACKTALYVVTEDGKELRGADGVLFAMQKTGFAPGWALLRLPPFVWIARLVYGYIAKNRSRVSSIFFKNAACGLDNRYPEVDD